MGRRGADADDEEGSEENKSTEEDDADEDEVCKDPIRSFVDMIPLLFPFRHVLLLLLGLVFFDDWSTN
jgi:hypothetical protein